MKNIVILSPRSAISILAAGIILAKNPSWLISSSVPEDDSEAANLVPTDISKEELKDLWEKSFPSVPTPLSINIICGEKCPDQYKGRSDQFEYGLVSAFSKVSDRDRIFYGRLLGVNAIRQDATLIVSILDMGEIIENYLIHQRTESEAVNEIHEDYKVTGSENEDEAKEPDPGPRNKSLSELTVSELREMAKERGISYSGMKKDDLIAALA